jgi:hypothetical protein
VLFVGRRTLGAHQDSGTAGEQQDEAELLAVSDLD